MRGYYSIADAKLAQIVEAIDLARERLTRGAVCEFILAERIGRVEYQRWLNTAPAELIAAWATVKLRHPEMSGVSGQSQNKPSADDRQRGLGLRYD